MAADDATGSTPVWPIPRFSFRVSWGPHVMSFREVSGLEVESEPLEYRHGNGPSFRSIETPGMRPRGHVTLRDGVVADGGVLLDWFDELGTSAIRRVPVTISLVDETGEPTMVWTLANAWPSKITGTDARSDRGEVAVETLEISHEGLTISHGRAPPGSG